MADKQDVLQALRRLLNKGDELDRCCACRSLGVLGSRDALQELVEHLRDDDIDVCIDAAESLGLLGDPRAVAPLIESLHNDPDGEIRVSVVGALGRLGGEQAIATLLSLLTSVPEDTDWDDDDAWDSNWDVQRKAVQALGYLRVAEAVAPLTALLDEEDAQVDETDTLLALARIGDAGEEVVIQRLQNGTTRERRRAAHALGQSCSPTGARALGRALQDPEPEVRAVAAEALAHNGQGRYLGALLLLLRDPADEVREIALKMAGKLSSQVNAELDVQQLLPLLGDPSARVRAAALHALQGHLPDELDSETQARMVGLLSDAEPMVAAAAIPHASCLKNPDIDAVLLGLLADEQRDPAVRQQAALALGKRPQTSEEVLTALDNAINDHEPVVRWSALQALMACHKKQPDTATPDAALDTEKRTEAEHEPVAPLIRILAALHGEAGMATAASAETTSGDDPAPASADATSIDLADSHEENDASSINETTPASTLDAIMLANMEYEQLDEKKKTITTDVLPEPPAGDAEAFQDFYDILARQRHNKKKFYRGKNIDIEADIRRLSARVLGECSQPEVVEVLKKTMLEDNPELQQEAVDALARLTPDTPGLTETLGPLNSLLHMGASELRVASARALGALGNLACLSNLQESLQDENPLVRSQSVMAMAQILERHAGKLLWQQHADTHAAIPVASARAQDEADTIEQALHAMSEHLADSDVGVSKAAALSLAKLNRLLPGGKIRDDIIGRLINAGFVGEGRQAREMGQALRALDPGAASDTLIQHLDTLPSSIERRFVLEMLEEVFRPSQAA